MTLHLFDAFLAISESGVPAANAVGAAYDYTDTAHVTELDLTDVGGVSIPNANANDAGVVQQFKADAATPLIRWVSGTYEFVLLSGTGVVSISEAAVVAAEAAQAAAEAAQAAAEAAESGVPAGGTTGQVLKKNSNDDGDADWADDAGGSGGTPDDGSVTNAKVAVGAAIDLAKTADSAAGAGRLALTTAERAAIAAAAADSAVVKLTGNQTVAGTKTFSSAPAVPDNSFTTAKVTGFTEAVQDIVGAQLDGDGIDVAYNDGTGVVMLTGGVSVDPDNSLTAGSDGKPHLNTSSLQPAGDYLTSTDIQWFLPLAVVTNFTDNPPVGFPDGGIVFSRNPSA